MHAARLTIGINYAAKWEAINRDQLENCINWKLPSNGARREAGAERPFQSRQITIKITFDPKTIYTHRRELRLRLSYRQSENCGRNHNYEALIAGASRACRIVSCFDLLLFYLRISLFAPRAYVCVRVCRLIPGQLSAQRMPKAILLFDKLSVVEQTSNPRRANTAARNRTRTRTRTRSCLGLWRYHNFSGQAVFMFCPGLPGCQSAVQRINLN